ncbi:hypothetical protein DL98DRAFT_65158 [Cadophora sp. DSE1049]|nr:hypothetical protein DL98DRAFT_65158 [Cadophora sp. DSE1049]
MSTSHFGFDFEFGFFISSKSSLCCFVAVVCANTACGNSGSSGLERVGWWALMLVCHQRFMNRGLRNGDEKGVGDVHWWNTVRVLFEGSKVGF